MHKNNLNRLRIRKNIPSQKTSSTSGGHAKNNINLLKVLNFVDKAMQTLSNYSEELQTHLDVNLTHQDMS